MKSLKCPSCGLVNFADAAHCKKCRFPLSDTGFYADGADGPANFAPSAAGPKAGRSLWENDGFRRILYGLLWIGGGVTLSFFTSFIFYGAVVFGLIDVLRGVGGLFTED
jgi:hypothetical protein